MMIAGLAVTAGVAGRLPGPLFAFARLMPSSARSSVGALVLTILASPASSGASRRSPQSDVAAPGFRRSLADAWSDPRARLFTIFVFVSMLAFSAQDLILEPFAGLVFGLAAGETTQLAGLQHGGVFVGMVITGLVGGLGRLAPKSALRT